jgi:threonine synthase
MNQGTTAMPNDACLVCTACRQTFPLDQPRWKCDCGGLLDIRFAPAFGPSDVQGQKPTMWRYRQAIPLADGADIVSFDEGFTPLLEVDFGGKTALIKQDHLFPSGSYKDRGASVIISQARAMGVKAVVEDSSGNAGCAIAAYCARARIACSIFVPADTAAAKLAQIQHYGSSLHRIPGSREDTASAVLTAAQTTYYASHSWNPFFFHGTKTFAYEVCEQLGWKAPDAVILPVGNGTLLLGVAIGFDELLQAGIVSRIPRLIAVQAKNCAPLAEAFRGGLNDPAELPTQPTLGEGIAIARPVRGRQILQAVRRSGGAFLTVGEEEIVQSLRQMCSMGHYIEPTSAATTAGLAQYLRQCGGGEVVVSTFTGHGLKTTEKMLKLL